MFRHEEITLHTILPVINMDGTKLILKISLYTVGYLFEHDVKFGTFSQFFQKHLVIINLQKHYCLTFSPAGKNSLDI